MAAPVCARRGHQHRARLRVAAARTSERAPGAGRARGVHVAALARGSRALLLLVEPRCDRDAGRGMRALVVCVVIAAAGCASAPGMFQEHLAAQTESEQACAQWYQALDRAV